MKTSACVCSLLASGVVLGPQALLADGFHFRQAPIPANEARLTELARIREFRANYELGEFCQGTLLLAELHVDGQATKTFRLARAKYDKAKQTRTGLLSFGWHRDASHLVSLNDNGDFYSPWTAKINLPGFTPSDACYFGDSVAEDREGGGSGVAKFRLYPVMGLCGERSAQVNYTEVKSGAHFVKACQAAGAKSMLVIYLYLSPSDEEPPLKFEKQG